MYGKRRGKKKERERKSANRESKGGKVLTSKRTKRERVSENGRRRVRGEGDAGCAGRGRRGRGKEGTREERRGSRRTRTKSGTKRPRV